MNILCLCYEFPPLGGGASRVVQGLLDALGDKVDLVTMGYRGLPTRAEFGSVRIYRTLPFRLRLSRCSPLEMVPYLVLALLQGLRSIRQQKPGLVHAHFIFPDGVVAYLLKRLTGVPYVITAHGSDVPGYNPDRFTFLHRILGPLWTRVTQEASVITCPSASLRRLLLQSNPDATVTIIPNGFDSRRLVPRPKRDRLLVVTRMFKRKGVQHLLQALKAVDTRYEVVIVGDGPYLPTLRAHADALGLEVRFEGELDNDSAYLRELYETSRIFALPSEAENFPVVLLEASSAGCAIITTSSTGCEEVVNDTALLIEPRDVEGLADAVERLVEDPALCAQLGNAARKRLVDNFEWTAVAERFRDVFHSIVTETPT